MESAVHSRPRRRTRAYAAATALLVGMLGLVAPTAAQADNPPGPSGPHTVSGTIEFPASAPSNLKGPINWEEPDYDKQKGIYLSLVLNTRNDGPSQGWWLEKPGNFNYSPNVSYNPTTGAWAVTGVGNGKYWLSISVRLPNNGSAKGLHTELTVKDGNVAVGTTKIKEEAHLVGVFGSCRVSALRPSKMVAENVSTGKTYRLEPGQRGETVPTPQCGQNAEADFGAWDLYGAPAGDYIVYAEQSGVTEYYTKNETGSQDRAKAAKVTLKYWEGNHTRFLYGFSKPIAAKTPKIESTTKPGAAATAKVGATLQAKPGSWTKGAKLSYQWKRDNAAIKGATKSTYKVRSTDLKKTISVTVTGTKKGYWPAAVTSVATKKVKVGTLKTVKPKASGTAKVGKTLKVKVKKSSWTASTKFSYKWYRNGTVIKNATKSTYKIKSADKGKKIKVKVTGKKKGYATKSRVSAQTAKVKR